MRYKVTKLNKRYTWHQHFSHRVEVLRPFYNMDQQARWANFFKFRNWCTDNFGISVEAFMWDKAQAFFPELASEKWAWYVNVHDNYRTFIYFADETALALFKLNWPPNLND